MLKRRLLFVALAVCLIIPALPVSAQEGARQPLWDLTRTFTVEDLGFTFNYPDGWVYDTSDGITFAENAEDLAKAIDDDDIGTQPAGYTIRLIAAPVAAFGLEGAPLDDVVDFILPQAGITVDERFDLGVMGRRTVTITGVNEVGRAGIASLWLQDGYVVIFSLGTPESTLASDVSYTWGVIVGGALPLNTLDPAADLIVSEDLGFDMLYPDGWYFRLARNEVLIYELEEDFNTQTNQPAGTAVDIIDLAADDIGLTLDNTIDEVLNFLAGVLRITESVPGNEYMVLGRVVTSLNGVTEDGRSVTVGAAIAEDRSFVHVYAFSAPDEEAWQTFHPTWLAMLQYIIALEEPQ